MGVFQNASDWLWGYDFFLSYSHSDGGLLENGKRRSRYTRELCQRLRSRGFAVFHDESEYDPGTELNAATTRRVRSSSKLLVIAREAAMESDWVFKEVQAAIRNRCDIVVIDINGTYESTPEDHRVRQAIGDSRLRFTESLEDPDSEPSDALLDKLRAGSERGRRERKRQRIILAVAVGLALLAAFAIYQWRETVYSNRISESRRLIAEGRLAFEEQPLVGVRIAMDALERSPPAETALRGSIHAAIAEMSSYGRLAKVGGDLLQVYPDRAGSAFVAAHRRLRPELWRIEDGRVAVLEHGTGANRCRFYGESDAYFSVSAGATSHVYRAVDGTTVSELTSQDSNLALSTPPDEAYFLAKTSDGRPDRLIRTTDGSVVETGGSISAVYFPGDPGPGVFVVGHYDSPGEIRRVEDASLVEKVGTDASASYRAGSAVFELRHVDENGKRIRELREVTSGAIVPLSGPLVRTQFSGRSSIRSTHAVLSFEEAPAELWATRGSRVAVLRAEITTPGQVDFSAGPAPAIVALRYDDGSAELVRPSTGESLATFETGVKRVRAAPAGDAALVSFDAGHIDVWRDSGAVRRDDTHAAVDWIGFGSDPAFYQVRYEDGSRELFAIADGRSFGRTGPGESIELLGEPNVALITRSKDDEITRVVRASDASEVTLPRAARNRRGARFVASGWYYTDELLRSKRLLRSLDGELVAEYPPRTKLDFTGVSMVLASHDGVSELRRIEDTGPAQKIVDFQATVAEIVPLDEGRTLLVHYLGEDGVPDSRAQSEIWSIEAPPTRLVDLGVGVQNVFSNQRTRRLVVSYLDGRAYVIDLDWLEAVARAPESSSPPDLAQLAAEHALSTGFALAPDPPAPLTLFRHP